MTAFYSKEVFFKKNSYKQMTGINEPGISRQRFELFQFMVFNFDITKKTFKALSGFFKNPTVIQRMNNDYFYSLVELELFFAFLRISTF